VGEYCYGGDHYAVRSAISATAVLLVIVMAHCRQVNDDGDGRSIREMLRALVKKLDKAADADINGTEEPRDYNTSEIQHGNKNTSSQSVVVNRVSLPLIVACAFTDCHCL